MTAAAGRSEQRPESRRRVVIVGAAGRDFHNFNLVYRDDPRSEVVAFTAAQIPGIAGRRYPPSLAGALYRDGIPIVEQAGLEEVCRAHAVDEVVFAYSDIPHEQVMHLASRALATGADFVLLGPKRTMLASSRPVIAITAVRTGCGKSAVARWLSRELRQRGLRVAVLRHPMPYGDLAKERVQRFATMSDLVDAQSNQLVAIVARPAGGANVGPPIAELQLVAVNPPLDESKFVVAKSLTEDGRIGKVVDAQGLITLRPA